MNSDKTYIRVTLCLAVSALLAARDAHAYVDPNSAGLLYQIFFPIVLALTLAWRWIKETCRQLWFKVTRKVAK
jgi:hypothetical protein